MHYNGAYSKSAGVSRVVLGLGNALKKKGLQIDLLLVMMHYGECTVIYKL